MIDASERLNGAVGDAAKPAIELRNVSFSYESRKPLIEGLSVSFPHGEVTSIVGPNGCGKSTMVKLVDGLLKPSAGEVLVEGVPTLSMKPKQRARKLAVLAQASRPPAMTVQSLVACGRYPYLERQGRLSAHDRGLVERAMELADVARFRDCDLRQMSGGERQRAFLAMTIAQDTDVIVLDEPTTYLDISACHELMDLIRKLNEEEGKTIVMVIHDLDLALRYSDSMLVMVKGSASCFGAVNEVLDSGALDRVFSMHVCSHESDFGYGYVLHPR